MKYYSRERILLAGTKYNSRGPNITRGDHILLAETKYYSREWNITRGNVLITRGTEKLLAGTKYYSREYNITRGNELLLAGKNITRGKELLLAGIYLLLAGTIYYSRERNIGSIWHQRASVTNRWFPSQRAIGWDRHFLCSMCFHVDGLVQETRNSIANALELRFSCINPSKLWHHYDVGQWPVMNACVCPVGHGFVPAADCRADTHDYSSISVHLSTARLTSRKLLRLNSNQYGTPRIGDGISLGNTLLCFSKLIVMVKFSSVWHFRHW